MAFTHTQNVSLAIVPKFSAALSIIADSLLLLEILYLHRSKLERVYYRIILSMALYDLSAACAKFLSTWPIPEESSIAFSIGNHKTCQAQGFFLQFGIGAVVTNCCLSCYFLLVIRFSWSEAKIRRLAEPVFYAAALVIAASTAIASYFLDLYNPTNLWCWIAPYPKGCVESLHRGSQITTCERGDNASLYRWVFYHAFILSTIVFATCVMVTLYMSFRQVEMANQKHNFCGLENYVPGPQRCLPTAGDASSEKNPGVAQNNTAVAANPTADLEKGLRRSASKRKHLRSRKIAMQGVCFVGAFYLTWIFGTVNRIQQLVTGKNVYGLDLMHALLSPSQGFWNYLVYLRPRYLTYREDNPDASLWKTIKSILVDNYNQYSKSNRYCDVTLEDGSKSNRFSRHKRNLPEKPMEERKEEVVVEEDCADEINVPTASLFANNIEPTIGLDTVRPSVPEVASVKESTVDPKYISCRQ